jgi:hypothetical protein
MGRAVALALGTVVADGCAVSEQPREHAVLHSASSQHVS